jgi:GT2 family glycosyltransferase
MKVSIITALFNCLELTRKCMDTLESTVPAGLDFEWILVDDGSTDGTRAFLPQWAASRPFCRVVLNPQNMGYARSNNLGASMATGTHLLFLNNDTELSPGWLEPMMQAYRRLRHRRPGIVGNVQRRIGDGRIDHAGVYINSRAKPDHLSVEPVQAFPQLEYCERTAATGACILVPAQVFREVGGFDEVFLNGGEDMDLNFKVRAAGYRVFVANRSVIGHHVSASPGRNNHHERNTRRVFEKWRDFLIREGARTWAREYLANDGGKNRFWQDRLYRECFFYARGWRNTAPAKAHEEVENFVVEQEEVWARMFPSGN